MEMREIKFKGIRKSNGKEWMLGAGISKVRNIVKILVNTQKDLNREPTYKWVKVIPKTVCLYTGVRDKEGIDIYGGDEITISYNYIGNIFVEFKNGAFNIAGYDISRTKLTGKNIHDKN